MSDASRAILLAATALGLALTWMAFRTVRTASAAPDRLVAELRLAQLAALALAFVAATYVGLAVAQPDRAGAGLDVALALGFFVVAAVAPARDPREALTILALGFAAHALLDLLHRPGGPPLAAAPRWYVIGCAVYNVYLGAVCYLPLLRR